MRKKFKSRRHIKFHFLACFFFMFLFFIFCLILRFFLSFNFISMNVVSLLDDFSINNDINIVSLISRSFFSLCRFDINSPNTILQSVMFYESPNSSMYYVMNDTPITVSTDNSLPLVYIYNTHDTEEYSDNYGVFDAAFYLQERLRNLGINSIVEENRTSNIRSSNGWNYNLSYKASRINLERVKDENPSIKLFIDLHRDSVGRSLTTVTIGDKSYAKVLFVIGREHANYLENLHFTQSIDYLISSSYSSLSKGILEKEGPGVNGIYNQDIGYNVILLEVGGNQNTSREVNNTLDVISNIIKEKVYE